MLIIPVPLAPISSAAIGGGRSLRICDSGALKFTVTRLLVNERTATGWLDTLPMRA